VLVCIAEIIDKAEEDGIQEWEEIPDEVLGANKRPDKRSK